MLAGMALNAIKTGLGTRCEVFGYAHTRDMRNALGGLLMAKSRNRPQWRLPLGYGPASPRLPEPRFRFQVDPWPVQCKATARATGKRCRNAALNGSSTCHKHGGHVNGYHKARQALGERFVPLSLNKRERSSLATLGALFGDVSEPSIIARGQRLEVTTSDGSTVSTARDTETEVQSTGNPPGDDQGNRFGTEMIPKDQK